MSFSKILEMPNVIVGRHKVNHDIVAGQKKRETNKQRRRRRTLHLSRTTTHSRHRQCDHVVTRQCTLQGKISKIRIHFTPKRLSVQLNTEPPVHSGNFVEFPSPASATGDKRNRIWRNCAKRARREVLLCR